MLGEFRTKCYIRSGPQKSQLLFDHLEIHCMGWQLRLQMPLLFITVKRNMVCLLSETPKIQFSRKDYFMFLSFTVVERGTSQENKLTLHSKV